MIAKNMGVAVKKVIGGGADRLPLVGGVVPMGVHQRFIAYQNPPAGVVDVQSQRGAVRTQGPPAMVAIAKDNMGGQPRQGIEHRLAAYVAKMNDYIHPGLIDKDLNRPASRVGSAVAVREQADDGILRVAVFIHRSSACPGLPIGLRP